MNVCKRVVIAVGCIGMIASAGCANKDIVKKEESITTTKAAAAPADSKPAASALKTEENTKSVLAVAAEPAKQSAMAAAQNEFEKIYFGFDSADLSQEARNALTRTEEILMKTQKNVNLSIEGHCDERGSAEYNLALGERRAKSAAKYLITMGVQPERLATISYGKERPAVQGNNEAAWSKNRRDELVIKK